MRTYPTLLHPNFFCAHLMCCYPAFHLPCYALNFFFFFLFYFVFFFFFFFLTYLFLPLFFFLAYFSFYALFFFSRASDVLLSCFSLTLLCANFFFARTYSVPCCALV